MKRKRILSGMRPTGKLHLGHLHGALNNWKNLQEDYECFYFIADWHALTTDYADTSSIRGNVRHVILDWLAVGLDPDRSCLFVQSDVKEHAELHLLLSMVVPLPWLERVPTYKEQQEELTDKDLRTYGFLGYPVYRRFFVEVDGQANQFVLYPYPDLAHVPGTEWDRVGLEIMHEGDAVLVDMVFARSDAEAQGVTAGDELLAIDGQPVGEKQLDVLTRSCAARRVKHARCGWARRAPNAP